MHWCNNNDSTTSDTDYGTMYSDIIYREYLLAIAKASAYDDYHEYIPPVEWYNSWLTQLELLMLLYIISVYSRTMSRRSSIPSNILKGSYPSGFV